MIAGRGFEICAIGAELIFRLGEQFLSGKGEPATGLTTAWESRRDEGKSRDIGEVMIAATLGVEFEMISDVTAMIDQAGFEDGSKRVVGARAQAAKEIVGDKPVGGSNRHVHRATTIDTEARRVGHDKIEGLGTKRH